MPLGFGNIGAVTTSDIGAGRPFTRLRGPLLVGTPNDNAGASNVITPPSIYNVSTARADMLVSVISSFSGAGATSSSLNVSTGAPAGLVYITMATGAGNLIAAASTANAPTGLPGGKNGVALCWDAAASTLALYDPLTSAWLWPHQAASSNVALGGTITWSASSS